MGECIISRKDGGSGVKKVLKYKTEIITHNTLWEVPANSLPERGVAVRIFGGGGGAHISWHGYQSGGGGGWMNNAVLTGITKGQYIPITIGDAGNGHSPIVNIGTVAGGTTSFGNYLSALGGTAGSISGGNGGSGGGCFMGGIGGTGYQFGGGGGSWHNYNWSTDGGNGGTWGGGGGGGGYDKSSRRTGNGGISTGGHGRGGSINGRVIVSQATAGTSIGWTAIEDGTVLETRALAGASTISGGGGGGGYGGCGGSGSTNQYYWGGGGGGGYGANGSNAGPGYFPNGQMFGYGGGGGGGYGHTTGHDGGGGYGLAGYGAGGGSPVNNGKANQGVCIIQYYAWDFEFT